jgi:hypothetical protein
LNEEILYSLAEVAIALAGFSGVVIAFRPPGEEDWTPQEIRLLWFLLIDSLLVVFLSLLPILLALADWSLDLIWGFSNAALGSWYLIGVALALKGEWQDRAARRVITVPFMTPILFGVLVIGFVVGLTLWLAALNFLIPRGQAMYVFGLMTLLGFAAVEFLFFIGRLSLADSTV